LKAGLIFSLHIKSFSDYPIMSSTPIDVKELRSGALDLGVVEPQGNESALLVQRVAKGKLPLPRVPAFRLRVEATAGHVNCAQSEPNAFADMQSTNTRECSSPSSIFAGMLSPALITHSSNHTCNPSVRNRSATARTIVLSLVLWLRKTSYWNSSDISYAGVSLGISGTRAGHQGPVCVRPRPSTVRRWGINPRRNSCASRRLDHRLCGGIDALGAGAAPNCRTSTPTPHRGRSTGPPSPSTRHR
jgi:hypothetical protein